MDPKIKKFFEKHSIALSDIKYIIREDGKTAVYRTNGYMVSTYHTVKDFKENLPTAEFLCPNKGILLAAAQIVDVSDGAYTMSDGRSFKYRVHNSQFHDMRLLTLGRRLEQAKSDTPDFSVLDHMPLPACAMTRLPGEKGRMGSFVFCYCNGQMLSCEGLTKEEILDQEVQKVFPRVNDGALVAYADVALNGTARIVEEYDPQRGLRMKVYSYQPIPGYCVCVMTQREPIEIAAAEDMETKVSIIV